MKHSLLTVAWKIDEEGCVKIRQHARNSSLNHRPGTALNFFCLGITHTQSAQSVSVTSSTLDGAEAKIAAQAQEQGAQYKITAANTNNRVHMTAELYK